MAPHDRIVLIGEVDQVTSALYQRTLRVAFEVLVATDEASIVHILQTSHVCVFILEVTMFGECDWEQLAAIGKICGDQDTQLVICSTLDERRRGYGIGAAVYLVKPTLPAILLQTIQDLIEQHQDTEVRKGIL